MKKFSLFALVVIFSTQATYTVGKKTLKTAGKASVTKHSEKQHPEFFQNNDRAKECLLHTAAQEGNVAAVTAFLKQGVRPDGRTNWNETPLHAAALRGYTAVVQALLAANADPCIESRFDQGTPLDYARRERHHSIVQLLEQAGAAKK